MLVGILLISPAAARVQNSEKINPELAPESHKKFFKADYPDDYRSPVIHHFGYPHPVVDDHEDYDIDYVNDKNDDNGYWSAQMEYDRLKNLLHKEQLELKKALAHQAEQLKELNSVKAAENLAEKARKESEGGEMTADGEHDKAQRNAEDLKNGINGGTDKLEKEMMDLEECKRQLAEARAKLKEEMAKKEAAEDAKDKADAAENKAEEIEVDAEKVESMLEEKVKEETKEHDEDLKSYKEEKKEYEDALAALEKAAEKLRSFRPASADPDGGVYYLGKFKGSAAGQAVAPMVLLLASMLFF